MEPLLPPPGTLSPKGTWRTYTTADGLAGLQTEHIAEDAEGYLWIGTWDNGACRFDGDEFRTFTTRDGLPSNRVQAMLLDRQGRLWLGTGGGACWYDGRTFHRFGEERGIGDQAVSFLFEDHQGRLWMGGKEVLGYCEDMEYCDLLPEYRRQYGAGPGGEGYDECRGIAQDREGNLWFSLFWVLIRWSGAGFQRYGQEEGLAAGDAVCQGSDGDLWVWSGEQVWRYGGQGFQPVAVKPGTRIRKIQNDREGRTWFCTTGGGVLYYDGTQFQRFTEQDGLAFNVVNAIHQDREGLLWFATWGGGLSCYDPHGLQVFGEGEGLGHNWQATLVEDCQGRIWAGKNKTIARYDGEDFTFFGEAEGLDLGEGFALCEDRTGQLWLGGRHGLVRYDGQQFQRIGTEEGFGEFGVSAIAEDQHGQLFLGHWEKTFGELEYRKNPLRITRYDGQNFQAIQSEQLTSVTDILEDRQGRLWFATRKGMAIYRPHQIPPRIRILQVNADPVHGQAQEVEVFDSIRQVLFEYKGLSFRTHPKDMLYTCRLQGYEEEWQKPTREMRAFYRDLPMGEYTFEVRAIDRDLNYSEIAEVRLKVIPDPRDARIDELEQRVRERTRELEEKNRALVVETALERVRGQALGMQKHGDFLPVAVAIFRELGTLGIRAWRSGFWIIDRDTGLTDVYTWGRWGEGQDEQQAIVRQIPLLGFSAAGVEWGKRIFEMWRNQQVFRISGSGEGLSGDRHPWLEYMRAHGRYDARTTWPTEFSPGNGNNIPFSHGILVATTPELLTDEQVGVLQKFAGVLSLAYTRFLDLQAAEERARQSTLEHALERVRAEVASMKESQDLFRLVGLVEESLKDLRVRCDGVGINTVDEEAGLVRFYGKTPGEIETVDIRVSRFYAPWKEGRTWHRHWTEADFKQWFLELLKGGHRTEEEIDRLAEKYAGYDRWVVDAFFSHGALSMNKPGSDPFTEEEIHLLERFTQVFSLGYARFLDLQAAEGRARQQARELAVEHVHNEALSMRSSEDLRKVVARILKEMVKLGVGTPGTNIGFVDEEADRLRMYTALENPRKHKISWSSPNLVELDADTAVSASDNSFSSFIFAISVGSQGAIDFRACWHEGKPSSFIQSPQGADILKKVFVEGWGFDRCPPNWTGEWIITNVPFQYGFVGFRERQYSEEHIAIVRELTDALSLGYVRFLDFQRLEEQNRALEEANAQIQEANQHKSQFLSRMSHDLRTPMNAIIGYTRILLRKAKDALDERQYQNLQNIQLSADHLLSLINDILDLSRIEAGRIEIKPAPVDLHKLVQECAAAVASLLKPGVALRQQLEEVPLLRTDPDRLRRALMNLLSNAVKFTERGSITVSLKEVEGWVELSVADTGVGIAAEDLPHIFEEFRQVERQGEKREGTGLGLAIAKRSVELLGGSISVESTLGRGTTFTLRLKDCEDP